MSGFEGQQGLCMGELQGCRKQGLHSKRAHAKSHTLQNPARRQEFERSLGYTHLLILESLPEREEAMGTPSGDSSRFWQQPFWGARSTTRKRVLKSAILESSLCLLMPEVYLPTSVLAPAQTPPPNPSPPQPAAPGPGPATSRLAATWVRASLAYQCTHGSGPCHNRRAYTAHREGTPGAYSSGEQMGVCCWAP